MIRLSLLFKRFPAAGIILTILIFMGGASWLASDIWGRSKNSAYAAASKRETLNERARLEHVQIPPAVAGLPAADTCAWNNLSVRSMTRSEQADMREAAYQYPTLNISDAIERTVRTYRPELAKLSEALHCKHFDPDWVLAMKALEWIPMSMALLVEGHLLLRDSKINDATTRYLEGTLLGIHAGATDPESGWLVCSKAFLAMARLMAQHGDAPVDRIDSFLASLDPVVPSSGFFAKHYRLAMEDAAGAAHREKKPPLSAPRYMNITGLRMLRMRLFTFFVPRSAQFALAMNKLETVYRRIELLPHKGASSARRAAEDEVEKLMTSTTNPFVYDLAGGAAIALPREEVTGWSAFHLAQAVTHLEKVRRDTGRVPSSLPSEPWTLDPSTDANAFRYEATSDATGYRIWSVGSNGTDDRGAGDDMLVQRF